MTESARDDEANPAFWLATQASLGISRIGPAWRTSPIDQACSVSKRKKKTKKTKKKT